MGILLFVLHCICSFFFLSRFFVKYIFTTVKGRNFKFGLQAHNDKLYRGIANGPSLICSSLYLFFFLSLQIFLQRYLHNHLNRNCKFSIEVPNDKLYRGIANEHSPICSSLPFSFSPDFSSKIFPQPFKIETANLVCRFTTSCIVELKMGLLLFVLPYICSFFFLSRCLVKDISTTV